MLHYPNIKEELRKTPAGISLKALIDDCTESFSEWLEGVMGEDPGELWQTDNKKAVTSLSSRSVLARLSEIQMLDVTIPATDGRELQMSRYTKPEKVHRLLLEQLGLNLPAQPPPEIRKPRPVVETF